MRFVFFKNSRKSFGVRERLLLHTALTLLGFLILAAMALAQGPAHPINPHTGIGWPPGCQIYNVASNTCTSTSGTGTVNGGTAAQIATYLDTGTAVSGNQATIDAAGNLYAPGNIASPNIPINVLAYNTLAHPVDITGFLDSTAGIQAALTAMISSGAALYFPSGTYKVSSQLLIQNIFRPRLFGNGNSSVIAPTAAMAGLSIFKFSAVYKPSIRDIWFEGNAAGQPKAAIEFFVPTAYTVSSQQADLENLRIGSDVANSIQYGVIWDHQAGDLSTNANNDQAFIKDVDVINFSVAAFQISGSNSVWHYFVGGHIINGPVAFDVIGGSFKIDGESVTALTDTVFKFEAPLAGEVNEFGSKISKISLEGVPQLIRTAAVPYPYVFSISNIDGKIGSTSGVNTLIDYKFTGGTFLMDADDAATPNGVNFNFAGTNQTVSISNSSTNPVAINYGSTLRLSGNHWLSGAGPTITSTNITGEGSFCEIGDRQGNSPQNIPDYCSQMSIGGTAARATLAAGADSSGFTNAGDYVLTHDGNGLRAPNWLWYQVGGVAYLRDTTDAVSAWYCAQDPTAPPCNFLGLLNVATGINFPDGSLLKSVGSPGSLGDVFTSQGPSAPPVWHSKGITGGTLSIPSGTQLANSCSTNNTVIVSGLTTSGAFSRPYGAYAGDPGALVGWGAVGGMQFQIWGTGVDEATWHICNETSAPITYSAIDFGLAAN